MTIYSAVTVHKFLSNLIHDHLRVQFPQLQKIHYFSDGAASKYKNSKNFPNVCYHKDKFDLVGEWNFFATSHGKSPCDGIGGTVKHLVRRASLQAVSSSHILTPEELLQLGYHYTFATLHSNTSPQNKSKFMNQRYVNQWQMQNRLQVVAATINLFQLMTMILECSDYQ